MGAAGTLSSGTKVRALHEGLAALLAARATWAAARNRALAARLLAAGTWEGVLLEHPDFVPRDGSRVPRGAIVVAGDLADGTASWEAALRGADCLVHFSAVNPYPNASSIARLGAPVKMENMNLHRHGYHGGGPAFHSTWWGDR